MEHIIKPAFVSLSASRLFKLVIVLIIMDIIFGSLRAIREKKFNSSVGIDGMIRKAGMLLSLFFLVYVDDILSMNLIGFIPDSVLAYLPIDSIGVMEFFAVVYSIYETISVLKNMTLSGLPTKTIWNAVERFLSANTGEMVSTLDECDAKYEKEEEEEGKEEDGAEK